jgi:hypothetical protein
MAMVLLAGVLAMADFSNFNKVLSWILGKEGININLSVLVRLWLDSV